MDRGNEHSRTKVRLSPSHTVRGVVGGWVWISVLLSIKALGEQDCQLFFDGLSTF